ncbi:MAG: PQQ-binding-like beta-propeller repeat protein [Bryobacterales bacterium]|nr:PQQ-binding-like beta-propeller repeat protein [Bryobacterales bacterium]MBV9401691.1 PQQ-binding-like beta-propeller repeat protein [Bryobacterales bacterium]
MREIQFVAAFWLVAGLAGAQVSTAQPPQAVRKSVQTTDGKTLEGQVLNEGTQELQLRTDDKKVVLLRKAEGGRYRVVTSQADWPTYHGDPSGNRYSKLTQINKNNAGRLATKWIFPLPNVTTVENTPVVVDGLMYVSSANECWALDAGSGRVVWHYQRPRTKGLTGNAAGGFNRGVATAGDRVFMLTDNAHMISMNRFNGELLWETEMADWRLNYNGTSAPLTAGNLVISGTAGGDEGVRGFVAAYEQATGKEVWRFWTVPAAGEPGSETWKGKNLEHRSGATWITGTYDPQLDTVYWPVGNPGPDFDGSDREGDNLYTDSIVALDAKTGKLKWYYQFTPHDVHDWDAEEPPVLVDTNWQGQPRKLLLQANRNGFFYVLDRTNGKVLLAKPFLKKLNWAEGVGADGRPILKTLPVQANGDTYVCPGFQGGTNWFSTSFNPSTGLYYFNVLERCNVFSIRKGDWEAGKGYMGGAARPAPGETFEKFLRALDIQTGEIKWEVPQVSGQATASAGALSTASGIVFFGENSGNFMAVDASNGKLLWQFPTNSVWKASPMTYMFDNKQYVAIAAGQAIVAFGLPE